MDIHLFLLPRQYSTASTLKEYTENAEIPDPTADLSREHLSLLSEFINPVYLQSRLIRNLSNRLQQEGSLELHSFLNGALAEKLKKALLGADLRDGIGDPERQGKVPAHAVGVNDRWELKGPPSRHRYLTLKPQPESTVEYVFPRSEQTSPDQIIRSVSEELFKSNAFRAWLMMVTTFLPVGYDVEARRFRPGLDYTLATSDKETRLDVVLGLTPPPPAVDSASKAGKKWKGKGKLKNVSTEDLDFWPVEWGGSDVSSLIILAVFSQFREGVLPSSISRLSFLATFIPFFSPSIQSQRAIQLIVFLVDMASSGRRGRPGGLPNRVLKGSLFTRATTARPIQR